MHPAPIPAAGASPLPSRMLLLAAAYVLFVCACFVVEGAGRRACQVPSRAWINAGADARERALRGFRRTKATECLDRTWWYTYPSGLLHVIGWVAPIGVVILFAKAPFRLVKKLPFFQAELGGVLFGFMWLAAMYAFLYPYFLATDFFDAYGIGGP